MSSSAVKFLAMLSPGSVNFDAIPGGGAPAITPEDVSAALSERFGLHRGAQLIAFYLMGDKDAEWELVARVADELMGEAAARGEELDLKIADGLARSALLEVVRLEKCSICSGSGKQYAVRPFDIRTSDERVSRSVQVRQLVTCKACQGNGVKKWSMNRRAKEAGINDRTYTRRYHSIREFGYRAVSSWLNELLAHLQEQLSKDA